MVSGRIHSIDEAVEKLYDLNVGVIGTAAGDRHERPHKPVLLLAALDLIADGQARPGAILWSGALRRRFNEYFAQVRSHDDQATPQNPFRFLRSDAIWAPIEIVDGHAVPLQREPRVNECDTGRISAALAGGLEDWVLTPSNRTLLRQALVARYFPEARARLEPLFRDVERPERVAEAPLSDAAGERERSGRSRGFRNKVLEIYDHQCTACGLRINIPGVPDGTFVDAAHLIPFAESGNDHPTNGLALCKNHHWAMDRFLIAPGADGVWRTSPRLIPHRSPGEQALAELRGQQVLAPREVAFMPVRMALDWRCTRLLT
jgi:putative restriction endonuclease